MKKVEREIFLTLISLPKEGYGLCNICRYAEWSGYSCCDCDLDCHCGIEHVEEDAGDIWQGDDCWAFRPKWSLEDTVDMVGIYLQGETPDMSKCHAHIPKRMRVLANPEMAK